MDSEVSVKSGGFRSNQALGIPGKPKNGISSRSLTKPDGHTGKLRPGAPRPVSAGISAWESECDTSADLLVYLGKADCPMSSVPRPPVSLSGDGNLVQALQLARQAAQERRASEADGSGTDPPTRDGTSQTGDAARDREQDSSGASAEPATAASSSQLSEKGAGHSGAAGPSPAADGGPRQGSRLRRASSPTGTRQVEDPGGGCGLEHEPDGAPRRAVQIVSDDEDDDEGFQDLMTADDDELFGTRSAAKQQEEPAASAAPGQRVESRCGEPAGTKGAPAVKAGSNDGGCDGPAARTGHEVDADSGGGGSAAVVSPRFRCFSPGSGMPPPALATGFYHGFGPGAQHVQHQARNGQQQQQQQRPQQQQHHTVARPVHVGEGLPPRHYVPVMRAHVPTQYRSPVRGSGYVVWPAGSAAAAAGQRSQQEGVQGYGQIDGGAEVERTPDTPPDSGCLLPEEDGAAETVSSGSEGAGRNGLQGITHPLFGYSFNLTSWGIPNAPFHAHTPSGGSFPRLATGPTAAASLQQHLVGGTVYRSVPLGQNHGQGFALAEDRPISPGRPAGKVRGPGLGMAPVTLASMHGNNSSSALPGSARGPAGRPLTSPAVTARFSYGPYGPVEQVATANRPYTPGTPSPRRGVSPGPGTAPNLATVSAPAAWMVGGGAADAHSGGSAPGGSASAGGAAPGAPPRAPGVPSLPHYSSSSIRHCGFMSASAASGSFSRGSGLGGSTMSRQRLTDERVRAALLGQCQSRGRSAAAGADCQRQDPLDPTAAGRATSPQAAYLESGAAERGYGASPGAERPKEPQGHASGAVPSKERRASLPSLYPMPPEGAPDPPLHGNQSHTQPEQPEQHPADYALPLAAAPQPRLSLMGRIGGSSRHLMSAGNAGGTGLPAVQAHGSGHRGGIGGRGSKSFEAARGSPVLQA